MLQSINRRLIADLALLAVVLVWGLTFVTVKNALQDIGVFSFLAVRFALAFVFLAVIFWRRLASLDWQTWKAGLFVGLWLFAGYVFQTVGLLYTTASNAGFITGLAVVLVPCFGAIHTRSLPGLGTTAGVGLAVAGLGLLSLNGGAALNYGDILVFFCAIAFALQIFLIGRYAPHFDAKLLTMLQIAVTGLFSGIAAAALEPWPLRLTADVWIALAITAIPATSLAFLVQTWAQQFTSASRTALIFSLEPVIAAAAGVYYLGEKLSLPQLLGCALILAGTLASELLPDSTTHPAEEAS